jgi:hypothetical protein
VTRLERDGTGAFHRRHELRAVDAHTVIAGIEDDMHRFEIELHHDGARVVAIEGRAVRWPWIPCADAHEALGALVGLPLTTSPTAVGAWTAASAQCTHQFDLAGLAVAHAARTRRGAPATRRYLAIVPDWQEPPYVGWLQRDGVEVLRWHVDGTTITAPEPFRGVLLRGRFIEWCETNLDDDLAEAAFVLRRALWMSPARHIDLEAFAMVDEAMLKTGVCYATQPQRLALGRRNRNSLRDYGTRPDDLLAGFPTAPPANDASR